MILNASIAAADAWLPGAHAMLELLTAHPEWVLYTALPLLASMVAVHLFFRHFVSVVWLALKATVAVVVYTHVRTMLASRLGPDPLELEPAMFGVPAGTLYLTASLGCRVAASRALAAAASACPSCFPAPPKPAAPPPPTLWLWGAPAWFVAAYEHATPTTSEDPPPSPRSSWSSWCPTWLAWQ
jgi:hypothetical protein